MRTPFAQFILKMIAVTSFIATFLLGDAFLAGHLPFVGAMILLPAATLVSMRITAASLRPARKTARTAPRRRTARVAAPRLLVVHAGRSAHTHPAA